VQVVVAHELLDPERGLVVPVAEALRDLRLHVARENVVLVAGQKVQLVADAPEEGERLLGQALLARGDDALLGQLAERPRAELRRPEPHRGVDVAEPAGGLLDVRLADVRRGAVLAIALVALGERGLQELGKVAAVDVLGEHASEAVEEAPRAREVARLLHGGPARKVGAGDRDAVRERAQAVPDLEPEIPERVQDLLRDPLHEGAQVAVVDHHHVDVRRRVELGAAVAAQRDEHDRARGEPLGDGVGGDQTEQRLEDAVDQARVALHGGEPRRAALVQHPERPEAGREGVAEELEPDPPSVVVASRPGFRPLRPTVELLGHDARSLHARPNIVKRGADL